MIDWNDMRVCLAVQRWIWQAMHEDVSQAARLRAVSAFLSETFPRPSRERE